MDIKTLRAVFTGGSYCKTRPLTRQDYGITLQFVHPDLPETYQVHFSNSKENTGTAKTQIATADGMAPRKSATLAIYSAEMDMTGHSASGTAGMTRTQPLVKTGAYLGSIDFEIRG